MKPKLVFNTKREAVLQAAALKRDENLPYLVYSVSHQGAAGPSYVVAKARKRAEAAYAEAIDLTAVRLPLAEQRRELDAFAAEHASASAPTGGAEAAGE